MIVFSLIGVGGLARDIGYPMLAGVLSTILMWAGPAQVLLFGMIASGVPYPIILLSVGLSSLRFLPMTIAIVAMINRPRRPTWQLLLAGHLVAITAWVEGMRRLPDVPEAERFGFFVGFALVVFVSGTLATAAGYYLIGALPPVLAAALLFTTPLFFALNLAAPARTLGDWAPILAAVALVPVAPLVFGDALDLAAVGLIGGTVGFLVQRRLRRDTA